MLKGALKRSDPLGFELGEGRGGVLDDGPQAFGPLDRIFTPDALQIAPFLWRQSPDGEPVEGIPLACGESSALRS